MGLKFENIWIKMNTAIGIVLVFSNTSCVDNYEFKIDNNKSVLIVDAILSDEIKAHHVILSKSSTINSNNVKNYVSGALVWIEDNEGLKTNYKEETEGVYLSSESFAGKVGNIYTLNVQTQDGKHYISEQELLRSSAPMDSVYGLYIERLSDDTGKLLQGIQFFIDAHHISNDAINFRYDYSESYKVIVPYASQLEIQFDTQTLAWRTENWSTCYNTVQSKDILTSTIRGLSEPKIEELPIRYVLNNEEQLLFEYLILVKQQTISSNAFQFYKSLKENNESAGSFSDKQKGTLFGNIHEANNSSEQVLGYFLVGGVSQVYKQFSNLEFRGSGFVMDRRSFGCSNLILKTIPVEELYTAEFQNSNWNVYRYGNSPNFVDIAPEYCSDCRVHGKLKKPPLWN